jgi:hypothetical protein
MILVKYVLQGIKFHQILKPQIFLHGKSAENMGGDGGTGKSKLKGVTKPVLN